MEKNKRKNREPFPPENTPEPPQEMDVSRQPESGTKESDQAMMSGREKKGSKDSNEKRLGESPIEIDDETTI